MGNKKFLHTPDPYTGKPLCISDPKVGSMDNPTCNSKGEPLAAVATIPTHIIEGWMKDIKAMPEGGTAHDETARQERIDRITEAMQNHLNHQPTHWKSWDDLFEANDISPDFIRRPSRGGDHRLWKDGREGLKRQYMNGRAMTKVRCIDDEAPWSHPLKHQGFIDAQIGIPEPDREHTGK